MEYSLENWPDDCVKIIVLKKNGEEVHYASTEMKRSLWEEGPSAIIGEVLVDDLRMQLPATFSEGSC